jgi:hypothetical protein
MELEDRLRRVQDKGAARASRLVDDDAVAEQAKLVDDASPAKDRGVEPIGDDVLDALGLNQGSNGAARGPESREGKEGEGTDGEAKAGRKSRHASLQANRTAGTPYGEYGASIDKHLERLLVDYLSSD